MKIQPQDITRAPFRLGSFVLRVIRGFKQNQGILLSGAVAYYTLLSIIPLIILTLVVLSNFIDEQKLFYIISTNLETIMVPGHAAALTEQVRGFVANRQVFGIIGFAAMLFFSSLAFSVLENAMSVIFFHRVQIKRRHFLISAIIPYCYISLLCLGVLVISFIAGAMETFEKRHLVLLGLRLEGVTGAVLYILGISGEVLMLTSLYLVMPVGRITFRHALLGGFTATFLWEITRRVLTWYYSTLSLVNVIYGSFATVVVILLCTEVAALILLLGAQVIAEYERGPGAPGPVDRSGFET